MPSALVDRSQEVPRRFATFTCQDCGKPFESQAPIAMRCPECRAKVQYEREHRAKEKARGKLLRTDQSCAKCGVHLAYRGVGKRPKYCEACNAEIQAGYKRAYNKRMVEQEWASRPVKRCRRCDKVIGRTRALYCETCKAIRRDETVRAAVERAALRRKHDEATQPLPES